MNGTSAGQGRFKGRARGVTLVESVLFLAIAMGLFTGGLLFFRQSSQAQKTTDLVRQVSDMTAQVRLLYRSALDYSDLNETVLIGAGAVPASRIDSGGTRITTDWGVVEVRPDPADSARFSITFFGVPTTVCTRLGIYSQSGEGIVADRLVNFEALDAGGTMVSADAEVLAGRPTNGVSPSEAAAACAAQVDGTTDIRWTFAR